MGRSGPEVADIFRDCGAAWRSQHGASLSTAQRAAMSAIERCRTAVLGGHVEQCDECGEQRICYNSCRSRNCPKCQALARTQWVEDRRAELLDTQYFHVVFTVPNEIAAIAFQNAEVVYDILFHATAETLRTIAADPNILGLRLGFSRSSTPGARTSVTIPTFTASSPEADCHLTAADKAFRSGKLQFFSSLERLRERGPFRRYLDSVRAINCRVGGGVTAPTPHRPGRADFPHPVLQGRD